MIRTCDGSDPNLIRYMHPEIGKISIPCNCGLRFNDVEREVIYPHRLLAGKMTEAEVKQTLDLLRSFRHGPNVIKHDPSMGLCVAEQQTTGGPLQMIHVCTRFAGHAPSRKHLCRCQFTWTDA